MNEDIRWIKTHCSRIDHGGCALLVGVKDNKIIKVKGDPDGYLNKGYICPKGLASAEKLTHPERLKYPLKRTGKRGEGRWERISWKEALGYIGQKLLGLKEEYGAKSVIFCQGMPKGMEHYSLIRLANIFGSPNVMGSQDVCHAPREVAGMHTCGFYPVADFHNPSKLTVLWGSNITSTNEEGEICSLLSDQIKNGTELIVVDPRRTKLAEKSKYWLQLRPGTDNALALAFLNVIIKEALYDKSFVQRWTHGFDELSSYVVEFTPEKISEVTWVSPELIRESARYYALSHPAIIQWGNAIEQHIHTFDTARALTCLMALCGNLDIPGGNIQANEPDILRLGNLVRGDLMPSKKDEMIPAHNKAIPRLMTVPPAHFKRAVLTEDPYPVKGAYMQCTNPLVCNAESESTYKALQKLDFLAVSEIFMTPTAAMANVVLPAATTFEFNDIGHVGLGHGIVLARPKIVGPPGECRPDIRILNDLGKIMTPEKYWYDNYEDFLEELLEPSELSYEKFVNVGYLKGHEYYRKYEKKGFKTPTRKVELFLSHHEKLGCSPLPGFAGLQEDDDPEYPLILTSRKSRYYLHSSYRWLDSLRERRPYPKTDIHPQTGAEHGIKEGDEVVIETRKGKITQIAHLTDSIHPKVIFCAYGWWFPEAGPRDQYDWEKSNYNMLTSVEKLGREFGTPNLKGINCRISKKTD